MLLASIVVNCILIVALVLYLQYGRVYVYPTGARIA